MQTQDIAKNITENEILDVHWMAQRYHVPSKVATSTDDVLGNSFLFFIDNSELKMFSSQEKKIYIIKDVAKSSNSDIKISRAYISSNYKGTKFAILLNTTNNKYYLIQNLKTRYVIFIMRI
jgi:hypothetical protein